MKKRKWLLACLLMGMLLLTSCRPAVLGEASPKQQSKLLSEMSKETRKQLKADFAGYEPLPGGEVIVDAPANLKQFEYLGTFGEWSAVSALGGAFSHTVYGEEVYAQYVGGYRFVFGPSQMIFLYSEHTIRTLKEAYETGLLSEEKVGQIHTAFYELHPTDRYDFGTYEPKGNYHGEWTPEKEKELMTDCMIFFQSGRILSYETPSRYDWNPWQYQSLYMSYIGTYSGCEAVVIRGGDLPESPAFEQREIAGFRFYFATGGPGAQIRLHRDHDFVEIGAAYETGLITKEDVFAIRADGRFDESSGAYIPPYTQVEQPQ